jgi:hypothetical protein
MASQSPEFPSVGARARWTYAGGQHECEIIRRVHADLFKVRLDDGECYYSELAELSPLPAAPLNSTSEDV